MFCITLYFTEVRNEASTSTAMQYEQEQRKLKELCEKYEEEVRDLRGRLNQDGSVFKEGIKKCYLIVINFIS